MLKSDVVLIGGGLIGGLCAIGLSRLGVHTIVIDKCSLELALHAGLGDQRTTAISFGSQQILNDLGVWQALEAVASPINHILVAEGENANVEYGAKVFKGSHPHPLGWIVPNKALRCAVLDQLQKAPFVEWKGVTTLKSVAASETSISIQAIFEEECSSSLLIGADGRDSLVRTLTGLRYKTYSYDQVALVGYMDHTQAHNQGAIEYFMPSGPIAALPLQTLTSSAFVWSAETAHAHALMALSEENFSEALTRILGRFLGEITLKGAWQAYPLSLTLVPKFVGQRVALIGDAAHGMHPVAGQGLNLGIRDVAVLTATIKEARRLGLDIGAQTVLKSYQRQRRLDHWSLLGMTHGMVRLFSNQSSLLKWMRQGGVNVVDHFPFLKRQLMRHAMGLSSQLQIPRLFNQ